MSPDSGSESEKGAPVMRLSRLGGAVRPPKRYFGEEKAEAAIDEKPVENEPVVVDEKPVEEAAETKSVVSSNYLETPEASKELQNDVPVSEEDSSIEKQIFNASQDLNPRDDMMLEESISREISMNGERIAKTEPKSDAIDSGEVRAGRRDAEKAVADDTESLVRRHETILPKSGFGGVEPVQTNWSDVLKRNKFTDAQRVGVEATLRAASIRQGKRYDVDYSDKIDLSSKKYERPFVLHFVSLREEETRRKIEAQNEIMHQLQKEVAEKPIEVSRADREEASKIVPEETHSDDKLIPAYPVTVHQPMNKWIVIAILGVIIVAIVGVVIGEVMRNREEDDSKSAEMMSEFLSGESMVEMTGVSKVETDKDKHESNFDIAWTKDSAKMRVWRDGVDYSVQDGDAVSVKFDKIDDYSTIALSKDVLKGENISEASKKSFINNLADRITGRWYSLSDKNLSSLRKKLDARYAGEIDCLGFLNSDFRDSFSKIEFDIAEAKDFKLEYTQSEWGELLKSLPETKTKSGFVRCWKDYDVVIDAKVQDEKISSVKVEMTNDNNSVEFNAEVKDDAEMVIDAPVRSYEDLLTSLQDDTKMLVYNARSEQIRQLCRSLTTECAEGQKQALNKSVEAAGDDYFLRLFGLMSE